MLAIYEEGWTFAVPRGDVMYSRIFREGQYAPAESDALRQVLRPGDLAVDVGANHGWFALLMAATVAPGGEVWALEPAPAALHALAANVQQNAHLDIRVVGTACGMADGAAKLYQFTGLPHTHASLSTLERTDYSTVTTPMRALDSLVDASGGASPALVKVDAEGSELAIIRGAERLVEHARPPIWSIEVNYDTAAAFGYRPRDIASFLRDHGRYTLFRITDDGVRRETHPGEAPQGATWLCVPETQLHRVPSAWCG